MNRCQMNHRPLNVLISAGPMRSPIDPVRFIQNRSSGQMGLELAKAAKEGGAHLCVLLGPVNTEVRTAFKEMTHSLFFYETAKDYSDLLDRHFPDCDIFISLSAVLDFSIQYSDTKLNRRVLKDELVLKIQKNEDFVQRCVSRANESQRVFAFSLESGTKETCLKRAYEKLLEKKAHGIFVNPVTEKLGPDSTENEIYFIDPLGRTTDLGTGKKSWLGKKVWETIIKGS